MESSQDPRAKYLAHSAAAVIGNLQMAPSIAAAPELHQFLNELNCKVLQILSDGQKFRAFANQVANVQPGMLEVHFVKIGGADEITAERISSQVMTSSLRNSSAQALHTYLNTVYGPVLFGQQSEESGKNKNDNQLRDLLFALKAGLQRNLRKGGSTLQKIDFVESEFRGILSPMDEIECW